MNWTEIILGVLALLGAAFGSWMLYVGKRREVTDQEQKQKIDNNIGITELNLKFMRDEINSLKEEVRDGRERQKELEEQITALKGGILTLSLFGTDAPLAMWAKDMNGRRVFHNKDYESMTGHLFVHCAGLTDFEITKNESMARDWGKNDDEVLSKGIYVMTIEPCAHKDTPEIIFMVLVIKWPTRIQGQVLGTEGVAIRVDQIQKTIDNQRVCESV